MVLNQNVNKMSNQKLNDLYDQLCHYLERFPSSKTWKPHNRPIELLARPSKDFDSAISFVQIKDENGNVVTKCHSCTLQEFIDENGISEADLS
jgi:hypothetical protein